MRPTTLVGLSEHYGAPAPDPPDGSFETFIRLYRAAAAVLRTPDDYVRLVNEVVDRHGGRVSAANGATGGASFRLELPRVPGPPG